jgi:hypothetical protein
MQLYLYLKLCDVNIDLSNRLLVWVIRRLSVRDGPLSPTLFGVFIDALEPWLLDQAPRVSVPLQTRRGVLRFLSTLMYADDIALRPSGLQQLIDHLVSFCT